MRRRPTLAWMAVLMIEGRKVSETERSSAHDQRAQRREGHSTHTHELLVPGGLRLLASGWRVALAYGRA